MFESYSDENTLPCSCSYMRLSCTQIGQALTVITLNASAANATDSLTDGSEKEGEESTSAEEAANSPSYEFRIDQNVPQLSHRFFQLQLGRTADCMR